MSGGYADDLDPEERDFQRLYGPWEALDPSRLRALMDGFGPPWWVVGGYAIEAFTGVSRPHDDVDLVVFGRDVGALREQLGDRFHLWSNHGGTLRPLSDRFPEPLDPLSQVWIREHALAPWTIDCILNPDVGGRWQSRHDESYVADLTDVSWIADDGIRYLNPEIALLFKAKQQRAKDADDLDAAWPLLSPAQKTWLRDAVRKLYPDHPWTERLADA